MASTHSLQILQLRTLKGRAENGHGYILTTCPPKSMTAAISSKDNGHFSPLIISLSSWLAFDGVCIAGCLPPAARNLLTMFHETVVCGCLEHIRLFGDLCASCNANLRSDRNFFLTKIDN